MKLFTHNLLSSNMIKGVKTGYPLKIEASEVRVTKSDFNPNFISKIIPKVEWLALYEAAESIGHLGELPKEPVDDYKSNEAFLKEAHRVMMEVEVLEGFLVCPESGRKFPITNGIANMLLNEDEV